MPTKGPYKASVTPPPSTTKNINRSQGLENIFKFTGDDREQ